VKLFSILRGTSDTGKLKQKAIFDYIQIEITSRCFSRCIMCPHTVFSGRWISKDMPLDLYKQISSYFPLARLVHLQGWGEPLLHPSFLAMLDIACKEAREASFTTNGLFLDRVAARKIIETGTNFVSFSIAGITQRTHKHLRGNEDLNLIFRNISYLRDLKKDMGVKYPHIHMSYMITSKNFYELPDLIDKAFELGVSEIVVNNMDYLPSSKLQKLALFLRSKEEKIVYSQSMKEASKRARKHGMKFKIQPTELEEVLVCEANPLKSMFVNVLGRVFPCTYLGIPVTGGIVRHFKGKDVIKQIKEFGSLEEEDLHTVWNKPQYKRFRHFYEERIKADRAFLANVASMDFNPTKLIGDVRDKPLPDECQTCYKAYGV
jgi:MoaA/NifB/PqqE/SkfB family radical SAM enzyme